MSRRSTMTIRAGTLREIEAPALLAGHARCYTTASNCSVICAREPARAAPVGIWLPPEATLLWHLSIAHRHRYPTWDEVAGVRYALMPDDVTMAMLLPPRDEYVNVHEFCLHLWQIEDRTTR